MNGAVGASVETSSASGGKVVADPAGRNHRVKVAEEMDVVRGGGCETRVPDRDRSRSSRTAQRRRCLNVRSLPSSPPSPAPRRRRAAHPRRRSRPTISDREADRYRDRCVEALILLAREAASWPSHPLLERDHLGPIPRVQLSIKISALSPHLDPIDPEGSYRSVAARLRPILDLAMRLPASLIFDMEQADTKALLVEIFTRLFAEPSYKDYPYAGLALQAYHQETERDIEDSCPGFADVGRPSRFDW